MDKTIFMDYQEGFFGSETDGKKLLLGQTEGLEKMLNDEYDMGWELISMFPVSDNGRYVLIFKKR